MGLTGEALREAVAKALGDGWRVTQPDREVIADSTTEDIGRVRVRSYDDGDVRVTFALDCGRDRLPRALSSLRAALGGGDEPVVRRDPRLATSLDEAARMVEEARRSEADWRRRCLDERDERADLRDLVHRLAVLGLQTDDYHRHRGGDFAVAVDDGIAAWRAWTGRAALPDPPGEEAKP